MTALELFTTLHACGVVLTPTCTYGDVPPGVTPATRRPLVFGLHVDAPQGVLTDTLRLALRTHKAALVELVEEWSESAAIAEWCGRVPRAEAEVLAWQCLVEHEALEVSHGLKSCDVDRHGQTGPDHPLCRPWHAASEFYPPAGGSRPGWPALQAVRAL